MTQARTVIHPILTFFSVSIILFLSKKLTRQNYIGKRDICQTPLIVLVNVIELGSTLYDNPLSPFAKGEYRVLPDPHGLVPWVNKFRIAARYDNPLSPFIKGDYCQA